MSRAHTNGADNEHLDDEELLHREVAERREYDRLWSRERQRGTTFMTRLRSDLLLRAWDRWNKTRLAARLRGLKPSAW